MPISIARSFLFGLLVLLAIGVGQADQPSDFVILNFTANWCQPCRTMSGSIERLTENGWIIRQVDVDREKDLVKRWQVAHLPSLILLKQGRECERITGLLTFEEIDRKLSAHVSSNPNPVQFASSISHNPEIVGKPMAPMAGEPNIDPLSSTVRIKIDDGQSVSFGTGTIIDQHADEALVLTCGHLFRSIQAQAQLTVDVPIEGRLATFPATVVDFRCDETDIGLIAFRPGQAVQVVPLLPRGTSLHEQEPVASFGCDHGADPSRRDSHISKLNRYLGPSNVEVARAPVQGRSGGGLFNKAGQLIGVCYAADEELDEGLYSGPEVVYSQLARLGLGRLYHSNPLSTLAANNHPPSIAMGSMAHTDRSAPNLTPTDTFPDRAKGDDWKAAVGQIAQAARDSAAQSVASIPRENVKPRENKAGTLTAIFRDPQGREQRMTIPSPSPALLQALQAQSDSQQPIAIR